MGKDLLMFAGVMFAAQLMAVLMVAYIDFPSRNRRKYITMVSTTVAKLASGGILALLIAFVMPQGFQPFIVVGVGLFLYAYFLWNYVYDKIEWLKSDLFEHS